MPQKKLKSGQAFVLRFVNYRLYDLATLYKKLAYHDRSTHLNAKYGSAPDDSSIFLANSMQSSIILGGRFSSCQIVLSRNWVNQLTTGAHSIGISQAHPSSNILFVEVDNCLHRSSLDLMWCKLWLICAKVGCQGGKKLRSVRFNWKSDIRLTYVQVWFYQIVKI